LSKKKGLLSCRGFLSDNKKKAVMAKAKSVFNQNDPGQGFTQVNSKAYGRHRRAVRGTYTPVVLNAAFKRSGTELETANSLAKIFKDAIDPYQGNFKDGRLWTRLVSVFKKQAKGQSPPDFTVLKGFELYRECTLTSHIHIEADCQQDEKGLLHITMRSIGPAVFGSHKEIDQYELKLIVVFPQPEKKRAETGVFELPRLSVTSPLDQFKTNVSIPEYASAGLLCVKLDAWSKGARSESAKTKGMAIVSVAKLS
jgi:hypothetical protein